MGLRINTDIESLVAQHRLGKTRSELEQTQYKLSSGSRIVSSKDDAAGLAISENLRSAMRCTGQNIKNAQNGFFLLQTAEGALNEITNITIRMKELAVQASSDTNGDKERGYLDNEYQSLKQELDRISATTLFNGRQLLQAGSGDSEINIQVGPNNSPERDRVLVASNFNVTLSSLGLADFEIATSDGARESLEPMEMALDQISKIRGQIGAAESRLQTTINNLGIYEESMTGAFSQIRDADMAVETSQFAKQNILSQAGVAVLAQANAAPQLALKLLG